MGGGTEGGEMVLRGKGMGGAGVGEGRCGAEGGGVGWC